MPEPNDRDYTQRLPRPAQKVQIVPSLSDREVATGVLPDPSAESVQTPVNTRDTNAAPDPDSEQPRIVPPQPFEPPPPPQEESHSTGSYEEDEPTVPAFLKPRPPARSVKSDWKVAAESVRGTSHEKTDMVCQDSNYLVTLPNNILLAAISDGAGSAAKAEVGSSIAAKSAVDLLSRVLTRQPILAGDDSTWETLLWNALDTARSDVEAEAAKIGAAPRDLACTLIVVAATPDLVAVGQIGDGAAVVSDAQDKLIALTAPQSGEYLNETIFLISPKAMEQAQTRVWRGKVNYLAAFSDGLQMLALKMSDGTPHPPFFTPLFRFIHEMEDMAEAKNQLNAFLRSPRITQRADDDLTLMLAHWPR